MKPRLLTSDVVKDFYFRPFTSYKSMSNVVKNRIVSWEYEKDWDAYFICYIDEEKLHWF